MANVQSFVKYTYNLDECALATGLGGVEALRNLAVHYSSYTYTARYILIYRHR